MSAVEREIQAVRYVTTAVLARELAQVSLIDDLILCTDIVPFPAQLPAGIEVRFTPSPFHFGDTVGKLVDEFGWGVILTAGGGSCPLANKDDFTDIIYKAITNAPAVVVNNPLSVDVAVISHCKGEDLSALNEDNFVGFLLQELGFSRIVVGNERLSFDLDTPTDVLILEYCTGVNPDIADAVSRLPWSRTALNRFMSAMNNQWSEVAFIGRVSPHIIAYVNDRLNWRTRVYAEERGMKALGRTDGEARSILADYAEVVGFDRMFSALAECCQGCLFDSRPILAHKRPMSATADRFNSDLGKADLIEDNVVRALTEAAVRSDLPVILGGHSVVSGGARHIVNHIIRHGSTDVIRHKRGNRKEKFS